MNALIATAALPTILEQPPSIHTGRREHIDDFLLVTDEIDRFNQLLVRLGRNSAPLNRDQIATAARELCARNTPGAALPCIGQQMRRVAVLSWMVADRAWSPANDANDVASTVIEYVRGTNDLIPDRLGRIGRLDDAIVVDAAWPRLAPEVESYLDFRRMRQLEVTLRGCGSAAFAFTRADWLQARTAEAAIRSHKRSIRDRSYLPAVASLFQVH